MNKMPWFAFYPSDWIKGTRRFSAEEKGVWIDLLCYMWEAPERGKIIASWEEIARMTGLEWLRISTVIERMRNQSVLDLTEHNGEITIICRRMYRVKNDRESNKIRQREFRKRKNNTNITDYTHKSDVISQNKDKGLSLEEGNHATHKGVATPHAPALFEIEIDKAQITPDELCSMWNARVHENVPRIKILNPNRERQLKARVTKLPQRKFWEDLIEKINKSGFLTGLSGGFTVTFDWILNPTNLTKVIEGNYDNDRRQHARR